uniref:E3 ubiquitin-protein transferase MAEA n=1 Tax=Caenorhabditis japonica TaxID=281687 RepID=A0A8R1ILE7_CAEJA
MERQQHGRYIIWHLLRCGYVKSAKILVRELNFAGLIDVDIFEKVHEVEKALIDRNTQPCLQWIDYHRSKLRKLGSRLEVAVRQQDVIEMVEQGMIPDAVQYVKKFLTPIAKANFPEELKKVSTTIVAAGRCSMGPVSLGARLFGYVFSLLWLLFG